jgi:hypothetical protein
MAYKLKNLAGDRCHGVVADSLQELRFKACLKLNLEVSAHVFSIVLSNFL